MDVGILQLRRGAELNARVHGRTIEQQKDGPRAERLRQLLHELQHSRDIAPVVCAVAHEHIGTGQDNVGQRFGCFTLENDLRPTSRSMRLACQQTRQLGPRVSNTYGAFSAFASTIIGGRTQANLQSGLRSPHLSKGIVSFRDTQYSFRCKLMRRSSTRSCASPGHRCSPTRL